MKDTSILKNFTVLYVEDDADTSEVVCEILKEYFKELFYASNGEIGLQLYKENKIDIVLSDIQMPIMNGLEMSKQIKQINSYQQIALFTAFNEVEYLKESLNLGIAKYISKPLQEEQFFDALLCMARVLQVDIDKKKMAHLMEIQNRTASLGEVIGNIAHQWRQPLSIITVLAGGLKLSCELEKKITNEEINTCVDKVVEQAKYLSKTIDDFRDFFLLDSKDLKEHKLKNIIRKLLTLFKGPLEDSGIEVFVDIDPTITLVVNENIFIQALMNVINNSRDALIKNVKDENQKYISIETKKMQNSIEILLKDNGGGIKADKIDKIYEPYFTTKHQSIGTGIGLYMTHQIITKHLNGTIESCNISLDFNDKTFNGVQTTITIPIIN